MSEDTLKGRCVNCGRFVNLNDAFYGKDQFSDGFVNEFCDEACWQAHVDTIELEFSDQ